MSFRLKSAQLRQHQQDGSKDYISMALEAIPDLFCIFLPLPLLHSVTLYLTLAYFCYILAAVFILAIMRYIEGPGKHLWPVAHALRQITQNRAHYTLQRRPRTVQIMNTATQALQGRLRPSRFCDICEWGCAQRREEPRH